MDEKTLMKCVHYPKKDGWMLRGSRPNPSLISKMCYKMFDESQKWSGYRENICKSQCVDKIYMVGFIIL